MCTVCEHVNSAILMFSASVEAHKMFFGTFVQNTRFAQTFWSSCQIKSARCYSSNRDVLSSTKKTYLRLLQHKTNEFLAVIQSPIYFTRR